MGPFETSLFEERGPLNPRKLESSMSKDAPETSSIQRFYDWLGPRYDWFDFYEGRAKEQALQALDLEPGLSVLNAGIGTGKDQLKIQEKIQPTGRVIGIDISPKMLAVAQKRTLTNLVRADIRRLPLANNCFDRLISTYVLDLIPRNDLVGLLKEFRRVLKPGGKVVLASLTAGVNLPSKMFVTVWELTYQISPLACGGCRPLKLAPLLEQAGFDCVQSEVILQFGVPSELATGIA